MDYNNILRTVRGLYPHSFREAQRLASDIRKSGVDPESEVAIMKAVSQISRRKDVAKMGEVDRMSGEMVGNGHTETLPIVPWTLRQARHSEVKRVGVKFSVINTSFQRLFGDRISSLTPKTSVSITVNVRIADSPLDDGKEVTMGPYNEEMPRLSKDDQYRFLMYTALKNGFTMQSGEFISGVGGQITQLRHVKMLDVRMGRIKLNSALIDKCNNGKSIKQKKGRCVQDYIWETCKGQPGFKRYDRVSLTAEINRFVDDKRGRPSTRELITWRDNCHTNVSIYALDPFYNKFVSSVAPRKWMDGTRESCIRLCFICKDNHCFPILNEELISKIKNGS